MGGFLRNTIFLSKIQTTFPYGIAGIIPGKQSRHLLYFMCQISSDLCKKGQHIRFQGIRK